MREAIKKSVLVTFLSFLIISNLPSVLAQSGPSGGGTNYCNDGVLHVELGEECDDGNLIDGDGCTKNCQIESEDGEVEQIEPADYSHVNVHETTAYKTFMETSDDAGTSASGLGVSGTLGNTNANNTGIPNNGQIGQFNNTQQNLQQNSQNNNLIGQFPAKQGLQQPQQANQLQQPQQANQLQQPQQANQLQKNNLSGDHSGHAHGNETCDHGGENGIVCDPGYGGNCTYCSELCEVKTLEGATCGDGLVNGSETCDAGLNNGVVCSAPYQLSCSYCSTDCQLIEIDGAICGDGLINDVYESCDDGNQTSGDGCSSGCKVEEKKSTPLPQPVQPAPVVKPLEQPVKVIPEKLPPVKVVEEVKKPELIITTLEITPPVVVAPIAPKPIVQIPLPKNICGDAVLAGSETCDDGNTMNGDGCSSVCVKEVAPKVLTTMQVTKVKEKTRQKVLVRTSKPKVGLGITKPLPTALSNTGAQELKIDLFTKIVFLFIIFVGSFIVFKRKSEVS